ncbi:hypothetical protein BGZ74_011511 [Mortierella antarctica]|nr:hypothetical protein BGZ74_011511 [Mortierella antarctica]
MSAIAPPAAFGSLYKSTTPEDLDKILRELDLASLEQEQFRLERAIQALVKSNKEIQEFIELEQQEQEEEEGNVPDPDPEFVLAIEENVQVIHKYEVTCAALRRVIREKRGAEDGVGGSCASLGPAGLGSSSVPTASTSSTAVEPSSATAETTTTATTATTTSTSEADNDDDGVYL